MIEGSTLGFNVIHGLPTFACQDNDATGLASGGLPQEPPGLKLGHRLAVGALAVF